MPTHYHYDPDHLMTLPMRPYKNYKNGPEGAFPPLPEHWDARRAKSFYHESDQRSDSGTEELMSVSHITGVTPRKENVTMFLAESTEGYKVCEPGDIVINTMWAYMAALGVARQTGIVSPSYGVYRPRATDQLNPRYVDLLLRTELYRTQYNHRSTGITSSRLRLYADDFLTIPIICPPLSEQNAIVRYLDHAADLINHYVSTKEQLITLLGEQRHAITHQAATRGTDQNAPMGPCTIPLIDQIPSHWNTMRLRNVTDIRFSNVDKHVRAGEVGVKLCNYVDVYNNDYITGNIPFMPATAGQDEIDRFKLHINDVLITKDSETWDDIGVPALVQYEEANLICGYHIALLRPHTDALSGRYLFRILQDSAIGNQFHIGANGVTRFGLPQEKIKSAVIPIPPLKEQERIADFLDEQTTSIETEVARCHHQIELVNEYRTRLIADVVTGQIDARHAVPELPEPGFHVNQWHA